MAGKFDRGKALKFIRLNDSNKVLRVAGRQTAKDREALTNSARSLADSKSGKKTVPKIGGNNRFGNKGKKGKKK